MPGKLKITHHTLADWDFEHGASQRELSAAQYVSAPTSLLFSGLGPGFHTRVLCRIPGTLVLPQGELRTWVWPTNSFFLLFIFRSQTVLGTANRLNCYSIQIWANVARLTVWINGIEYVIAATTCHYFLDEWTHYRIFWYIGKTPGDEDALCVDLYYEVAGEWVKEGNTMYDTNDRWADSDKNRCGLNVYLVPWDYQYFDDTEIWGPV